MSYTNQTTHYGIPLPTENDLVNGLDWNTSSEAIDSALYGAAEAASTATTEISAIKATIVQLGEADVQFQRDLNETNGRVATLEQNAGKDEQDIQDLADMVTDKEVAQAQSDVHVDVGEWFRYNGVLYVCTVEINIGDTIIPNTNCRATNIEDEMYSTPSTGDVRYDTATNKQQYYDGTQWVDIPSGGGNMKCALYGTLDNSGSTTVDISSLDLSSAEDYFVIISGDGAAVDGNGVTRGIGYVSAKTSTSFTVSFTGAISSGFTVSYQVITLV